MLRFYRVAGRFASAMAPASEFIGIMLSGCLYPDEPCRFTHIVRTPEFPRAIILES